MPLKVTLRTGRFWLDEEGFLRGECFEGAEETLVDAEQQVREQRTMTSGLARPFLMDISRVRSLSRDARNYFAHSAPAREIFSCVALVVGSPLSRADSSAVTAATSARLAGVTSSTCRPAPALSLSGVPVAMTRPWSTTTMSCAS